MVVHDAPPTPAAAQPATLHDQNDVNNAGAQAGRVVEEEKHVVVEIPGWLRLYSDGSVDRTWRGPPEFQFLASPYFPSPSEAAADGISLYDLNVGPSSDLSLRIYLPTAMTGQKNGDGAGDGEARPRSPVLLHFHGGGFCITRPNWYMYYHFYARLARETGAPVVSVYTRPAPEHRLPAAIDDCFAGLLWLRSLAHSEPAADGREHRAVEALRRSADFSRVFLIGDSSGGNLVHEVAARAGRKEEEEEAGEGGFWAPLRVAGAMPLHPGFVRESRSQSEMKREFEGPLLTLEMVDKLLALALPEGSTRDHPYTCPMGGAAPPMEWLRMPRLLVAVAERDLLHDAEVEYCDAMRAAGKDVAVVVSPRMGHCFHLNKVALDQDPDVAEQTAELIAAIKAFVARY